MFSHVGIQFLLRCLEKNPTLLHLFLFKHFVWLPVTFGFSPQWIDWQERSPQSALLLKAALPEEKIPLETHGRGRTEEDVAVDGVLLILAKSDLEKLLSSSQRHSDLGSACLL